MAEKQLYTYLYFSISNLHASTHKKDVRLKKSLPLILTNLIFFYTKHLLIKQNKKYHRHINMIPGTKALLVGLWATSNTYNLKSGGKFIKYLYMYYLHSTTFIIKYYI